MLNFQTIVARLCLMALLAGSGCTLGAINHGYDGEVLSADKVGRILSAEREYSISKDSFCGIDRVDQKRISGPPHLPAYLITDLLPGVREIEVRIVSRTSRQAWGYGGPYCSIVLSCEIKAGQLYYLRYGKSNSDGVVYARLTDSYLGSKTVCENERSCPDLADHICTGVFCF